MARCIPRWFAHPKAITHPSTNRARRIYTPHVDTTMSRRQPPPKREDRESVVAWLTCASVYWACRDCEVQVSVAERHPQHHACQVGIAKQQATSLAQSQLQAAYWRWHVDQRLCEMHHDISMIPIHWQTSRKPAVKEWHHSLHMHQRITDYQDVNTVH